jgi:hypothetical protein
VLLTRLGFWLTGWAALDLATFLAAALLPLAALLIVEALLRRHAPLPLKAGAVGGALALWGRGAPARRAARPRGGGAGRLPDRWASPRSGFSSCGATETASRRRRTRWWTGSRCRSC